MSGRVRDLVSGEAVDFGSWTNLTEQLRDMLERPERDATTDDTENEEGEIPC